MNRPAMMVLAVYVFALTAIELLLRHESPLVVPVAITSAFVGALISVNSFARSPRAIYAALMPLVLVPLVVWTAFRWPGGHDGSGFIWILVVVPATVIAALIGGGILAADLIAKRRSRSG